MKRIPDGTVLRRDNQWDISRKRALFTSDGPDSATSGSHIPEGHSDRPPEVEYSDILISGRPQDEGGTEGLCSPSRQLEIAVVWLQKDIDDYRTELELTRKQTPAVTRGGRGSHRRQFQDSQGSRTGSNTVMCLRPLYVRIVGTMSRQLCSCSLIWTGMHSRLLYLFRSLGELCRDF